MSFLGTALKIIQLIPTSGHWRGLWVKEKGDGDYFTGRVAAWALVDDSYGDQSIIGIDPSGVDGPDVDSFEEGDNFVGYYDADDPQYTAEELRNWALRHLAEAQEEAQ